MICLDTLLVDYFQVNFVIQHFIVPVEGGFEESMFNTNKELSFLAEDIQSYVVQVLQLQLWYTLM